MRFIRNDLDELAAYVRSLKRGLVAFDGRPMAGKTYLANAMRERVPCTSVDADDFIVRDQKKFLGALMPDTLRDRIEQSLATSPLVVLSGVCARQVVERVGRPAAAFVWIERSSLICLEIDERDFDGDHNADHPHGVYAEVEPYIVTYNARMGADVVYLNAHD